MISVGIWNYYTCSWIKLVVNQLYWIKITSEKEALIHSTVFFYYCYFISFDWVHRFGLFYFYLKAGASWVVWHWNIDNTESSSKSRTVVSVFSSEHGVPFTYSHSISDLVSISQFDMRFSNIWSQEKIFQLFEVTNICYINK